MSGRRAVVTAAATGVLLGGAVVGALLTAPAVAGRVGVAPPGPPLPGGGELQPCGDDPACLDEASLGVPGRAMAALLAGVRQHAGCTAPISLDARLAAAAQQHATALADGARPSHVDPFQRTPQDRADAQGYPGLVVETIAAGIDDPAVAVGLWLDPAVDPTVAGRITDCGSRHLGIGWSDERPGDAFGPGVWVVLHGRPD